MFWFFPETVENDRAVWGNIRFNHIRVPWVD
jgi:hypothetical protein